MNELMVARTLCEFIDPFLIDWTGRAADCQSNWTKTEIEDACAQRGLVIIVSLGCGPADQFNLAIIQAEALIGLFGLRLLCAFIREEDAGGAAFDD